MVSSLLKTKMKFHFFQFVQFHTGNLNRISCVRVPLSDCLFSRDGDRQKQEDEERKSCTTSIEQTVIRIHLYDSAGGKYLTLVSVSSKHSGEKKGFYCASARLRFI